MLIFFTKSRSKNVMKKFNKCYSRSITMLKSRKSKRHTKPIRHNKPNVENLGEHLVNIFGGKDASVLSGFTDSSWLQVFSEVGNDLLRWPTEKHFTSWLGLSPGQNNLRKRKRRVRKGSARLARSMRECLRGAKDPVAAKPNVREMLLRFHVATP